MVLLHFTDYSSGFGGKFGVQNDRLDKSAVGWDHVEKVEKHDSQKGRKFLENDFPLNVIFQLLLKNALLQNSSSFVCL